MKVLLAEEWNGLLKVQPKGFAWWSGHSGPSQQESLLGALKKTQLTSHTISDFRRMAYSKAKHGTNP